MNALSFNRLLPAAFALAAAFFVAACDGDDDSDRSSGKSSAIVGHWYDEDKDNYDIQTFRNDGTFENTMLYYDGKIETYASGTYVYDRGKVTWHVLAGEDFSLDNFTCKVTVKGETMYVEEEDGDTYALHRMSDAMYDRLLGIEEPEPEASIVGHWCQENTDASGETDVSVLSFSADGRFEDAFLYGGFTDRSEGRYRLSGSELTMTYDDGETVTVLAAVSASALVLRLSATDAATYRRMSETEYDRLF